MNTADFKGSRESAAANGCGLHPRISKAFFDVSDSDLPDAKWKLSGNLVEVLKPDFQAPFI